MKKVLALLLSLTLVIAMFTACGKKNETEETTTTPTEAPVATEAPAATEEPAATEAPATDAAGAKTGLAIVSNIAQSTDAADADGTSVAYSTAVAVLVGADGKILDCKIDAIQSKVSFSKEGKLTTDLAAEIKTKQELGADYGMVKASSIGKEWNEQANAFAAYVIGKTVDEVKGIAVNEEGATTDADLAASVTIKLGDYIGGIEKAVASAQELGAKEGDKLGLAITSDVSGSTDATADAAGLAKAYNYYTAVSVGADGKITSSVLDASIVEVNFDTTGKITTDLASTFQSKQELKDAYGMKKASAIGKEWFEQANAFATYVTGKTLDEVNGMTVTEDGLAGDADLASSVTVHVGDFIKVINKGVTNAQ